MRIVGGEQKGRRLPARLPPGVRPTSDRLRESLFNRLIHGSLLPAPAGHARQDLADVVVLDAFCGTGALGLEALSRGAPRAFFLDITRACVLAARENAEALGLADRASFIRADATAPPTAPVACGLCFIDPPYGQDLTALGLTALYRRAWLRPGALCVAERAAQDTLTCPKDFTVLDDRRQGDTAVALLRAPGTETGGPPDHDDGR